MRVNETAGVHIMHESLDPDVIHAQKMADLQAVAEWRARKLKAIKEWSDTEARSAKLAEAAAELEKAHAIAASWGEIKTKGYQLGMMQERAKPIVKPKTETRLLRLLKRLGFA